MKQKETQQETMSKEKRVVFFEGKSWYHRTKELQDDLTTKYGKKGGFETPEEAEKSYWEYEKRYQTSSESFGIFFRVITFLYPKYPSSLDICPVVLLSSSNTNSFFLSSTRNTGILALTAATIFPV